MVKSLGAVLMAALSGVVAATDLTVGPAGTGAQFTSIPAAVAAAQPGDRVLVMAGDYTGAVVVDKAIEIVGAGSNVTFSRSMATMVPGLIAIPAAIGNLGPGSRARVSGITFGTIGFMAFANPATMIVHDCLGRVELNDIALQGGGMPPLESGNLGGILYVRDCAQVVASGVHALGSLYTFILPVPGEASLRQGHAGVLVERSSFWMTGCQADGNATRFVSSGFGGDGGAGLKAIDSTIHVGRSVVRGAQSGGRSNGIAGLGGAGIELAGTSALLHGGPPNAVMGALAFEQHLPGITGFGTAGPALALDGSSAAKHAVDVALVPGSGSASLAPAPAIASAAGATVVAIAERLPTVSLSPATVPLGGALTVMVAGQPNLPYVSALALQTMPAFQFPGVSGALLVAVPEVLAFTEVLLDFTGISTSVVVVPGNPALAGFGVVQQSAQILPWGIALSPPALLTLR